MSHSTSRPMRNRIASPFAAHPTNNPSANATSPEPAPSHANFTGRWLEPAIPPPIPSFQESGHERLGVVANMLPLGTLPSAKLTKAAKKTMDSRFSASRRPEGPTSLSKSSTPASQDMASREDSQQPTEPPPRSFGSTPLEEPYAPMEHEQQQHYEQPPYEHHVHQSQPPLYQSSQTFEQPFEPQPQQSFDLQEFEKPFVSPYEPQTYAQPQAYVPPQNHVPDMRRSLSARVEEQELRPQTPMGQTIASKSMPRSAGNLSAQQYDGQGTFQIQMSQPQQNVQQPVHQATPQSAHSNLKYDASYMVEENKIEVGKAIAVAVDRAIEEERYPTAYALRTIYDDFADSNRGLMTAFVEIMHGSATAQQEREWEGAIKARKLIGDQGNTAYNMFFGDGSEPPPSKTAPLTFPAPAPEPAVNYPIENLAMNIPELFRPKVNSTYRSPYDPPPPPPALSKPNSPKVSGSTTRGTGQPPNKKHKGSQFDNGVKGANGAKAVNGSPSRKSKKNGASSGSALRGSERSTRSRAVSSSSLSSVDETMLVANDDDFPRATGKSGRLATKDNKRGKVRSAVEQNNDFSSSFNSPNFASAHSPPPHLSSFDSEDSTPSDRMLNSQPGQTMLTDVADQSNKGSVASAAPKRGRWPNGAKKGKKPAKPAAAKKQIPPVVEPDRPDPFDSNGPAAILKRKARHITNSVGVQASYERDPPPADKITPALASLGSEDAEESVVAERDARPTRPAKRARTRYDSEHLSSPGAVPSTYPDFPPGSVGTSRAATPSTLAPRATRKAKAGSGLRTKTSPTKKKHGTSAGGIIEAANGVAHGYQNEIGSDDHVEKCSACGCDGELVLCDRCPCAFHFGCYDPAITLEQRADEYFDFVCQNCSMRNVPLGKDEDHSNAFGGLNAALDRLNPKVFRLPADVRDLFIGYTTGEEGQYVPDVPLKPRANRGYDEAPDHFKLTDKKGKFILCHNCNKGPRRPDRSIIQCGYCSLSWHMDCLDPPMAKEPGVGKLWRCPAHADVNYAIHIMGPSHKVRMIKNAATIKQDAMTGRNFGHIEIESEPSDDESPTETILEPGFFEQRAYGRSYTMSSTGVKLRFIKEVKARGGALTEEDKKELGRRLSRCEPKKARTAADEEAAVTLTQLANKDQPNHQAHALTDYDAEEIADELMNQGPKVAKMSKEKLKALQALINSALDAHGEDEEEDRLAA